MLDDAGFEDCPICASNSLDEYIIRDMLMQGAKVDSFGVGERLITSSSEPVFGGVYKLAAVEDPGRQHHPPRLRLARTSPKSPPPALRACGGFSTGETDKAIADVITLHDEVIDDENPIPSSTPTTPGRKTVENFTAVSLLQPIFKTR